ncbi:flagellar hook-length control protein FliK [Thiohalobacter sp. COW1]|uniref:flagellar hook-length control protein FliK n=1 Tax=Thiohalobacter sp. COW1 TaxID=2795687 RepID=UPI0019152026|nr:flagellar hook-length control protein FliK [Thiohalobacter sp. COW1]BCO31066.1 flagellar hook-length control protein FliK [Thiohalobacter sp. COW1]
MAELPVTPVKVQSAPAKASGQGPARQSEAADSDNKSTSFSSELNKRMDAGKAERDTGANDSGKAAAAGRGETSDPAEGKNLPVGDRAGHAGTDDAESGDAQRQAGLAGGLLADGEGRTAATEAGEETEVSPLALAQMLLDAAPARGAEAAATRPGRGEAGARLLTQPGAQPQLAQGAQDALQEAELSTDLFRQFLARGGEQRSETAAAQLAQLAARNPDASGLQRLASAEIMPNLTPSAQGMVQTAQLNPTASQPALPGTQIPLPMQHSQWGDALSEKVMWVANQKLQGAEIKLNPQHLGPIEVRVSLNSDSGQSQAQVHFTAQHAMTREALEAAMPRLREMFTANGMDLVDVNVSDRSFAEQDQASAQAQQQQFMAGMGEADEGGQNPSGMSAKITQLPTGMLDLFA